MDPEINISFNKLWDHFGVHFGAEILLKRGPKIRLVLDPLGPASQGSGSCDFRNSNEIAIAIGIALSKRKGGVHICMN